VNLLIAIGLHSNAFLLQFMQFSAVVLGMYV
jgi:hypothetical protein